MQDRLNRIWVAGLLTVSSFLSYAEVTSYPNAFDCSGGVVSNGSVTHVFALGQSIGYQISTNSQIIHCAGVLCVDPNENIYSVDPSTGPSAGGNLVSITNRYLLGNGADITSLTVCGVPAAIVDQGTNWVTGILGAGPGGGQSGDVVIQSVSEGETSLANAYTYNPAGTVNGISPTNGFWSGGYPLVISGENLGNGSDITNITVCGVDVQSIDSQSSTQIVVTVASGTAGLGDIAVCSTSYGITTRANGFEYLKTDQTTTFTNPGDQITTNTLGLTATATSGLNVTNFGVVSGPAVLDGSTVTFTGSGTVVLSASQAGNINWNATPVTNVTFNVSKADQAIVFTAPQNQTVSSTVILEATASSGLNVVFNLQEDAPGYLEPVPVSRYARFTARTV